MEFVLAGWSMANSNWRELEDLAGWKLPARRAQREQQRTSENAHVEPTPFIHPSEDLRWAADGLRRPPNIHQQP